MTGPQWVTVTEHLQAWQVTEDNLHEVAAWCGGDRVTYRASTGVEKRAVDTPAGGEAEVGDWVVRGCTGHFGALSDAMFRDTYTPSGPPPEKPTRGVLTGEALRITRRQ